MKIAIDGRVLLHRPVGIANFLISALNRMMETKPSWDYYIFINRDINHHCLSKIKQVDKIKIIKSPMCIFPSISTLWYILKLPFLINKLKPDIFWAPANITTFGISRKIKVLLTVQDLVSKRHSNTMLLYERFLHNLLFSYSVYRADIIWSISKFTEMELLFFYPRAIEKRRVNGCSIEENVFSKNNYSPIVKQRFLEKSSLPNNKFLLFVGTIEPRKNLIFLINLMKNESLKNIDLVVVGANGWGGVKDIEKTLDDVSLRERVHFLNFISSEELIYLYNTAEALIMPSLYEGFGLPILEAMSCSCPVVTSQNSGMVEVVGNAGLTVNGWVEEEWIKSILLLLSERVQFSEKGLKRVLAFNWTVIINNVISAVIDEKKD